MAASKSTTSKRALEYNSWSHMWRRCTNPKHKQFEDYGGRGIKVCPEWADFRRFCLDMGPRPSRLYSIDRINNDGDYEPSNCRWATPIEQSNNRRPRRIPPLLFPDPKGEANGRAILNDVAVRVIRFLAAKGVDRGKLARAHGMSRPSIDQVIRRFTWRHIV